MSSSPPLIMDNGSYQIKFGFSIADVEQDEPNTCNNCIAKETTSMGNDRFYIGNQMDRMKSNSSSVYVKRPVEKGQLTSWEIESKIWDYCFYNPTEFSGFEMSNDCTRQQDLILSENIFTLPELSRNTDQIVFEEYSFDSLYKAPTATFIPFNTKQIMSTRVFPQEEQNSKGEFSLSPKHSYNDFQFVIDSGFNCTWVIPIIKGVIHYKAVKKCDIGGRFLTGFLKEMVSFRHYDVSNETILINNIKEQCCFVSPNSYTESFQNRQATVSEYVLPDYQSNHKGFLLKDTHKTTKKQDLLRDGTYQSLSLSDELFAVPETIFHPEIARLVGQPGLIEVIMESLSMVPEVIRPLLVGNIVLIGGNFNIKNFKERLCKELQVQCPIDWKVRASCAEKPSEFGFQSMCKFSESQEYQNCKVTREEYFEKGSEWVTKNRFGYEQYM